MTSPRHAAAPLACARACLSLLAATALAAGQILPGEVVGELQIDAANGGFGGTLAASDGFGSAVTSLGDVDGDGVDDLAVGASSDSTGGLLAGAVWILFLEPDGTVREELEITEGLAGFGGDLDLLDEFGEAVQGLGDLDGNGVPDLAVGADFDDSSGSGLDTGAVWILFLASDGTVQSEVRIGADGAGGFGGALLAGDRFGSSIAALGDVDGDGVGDLAVGAQADAGTGFLQGAVWVLFLASDGTVKGQQRISTVEGGFGGDVEDKDRFGVAVAALGDLDGNGVPDLAVGANQDDDGDVGNNNRGAVWILFLAADGTVVSEQKISETQGGFTGDLDDQDLFGQRLATLPDIDGDLVPELAVSAINDDDGGTDTGAVHVLLLAADGTVKAQRKLATGSGGFTGDLDDSDRFGTGLAWLDAPLADGVGTLVVAADGDDDGGSNLGGLWLLALTDGKWVDVGGGLPGSAGVPGFVGEGSAAPGTEVTLTLTDGLPGALDVLVVGASAANLPLAGGVLVPSPDGLAVVAPPSANGLSVERLRWPPGLPSGTTLWFQHWIADPAGPAGWAATGALATTTP